jgi:hypothetical protein
MQQATGRRTSGRAVEVEIERQPSPPPDRAEGFYRNFYRTGRNGLLSTGTAQHNSAAKSLVKPTFWGRDGTWQNPWNRSSSPPSPTVKVQVRGYFRTLREANFYRTLRRSSLA